LQLGVICGVTVRSSFSARIAGYARVLRSFSCRVARVRACVRWLRSFFLSARVVACAVTNSFSCVFAFSACTSILFQFFIVSALVGYFGILVCWKCLILWRKFWLVWLVLSWVAAMAGATTGGRPDARAATS